MLGCFSCGDKVQNTVITTSQTNQSKNAEKKVEERSPLIENEKDNATHRDALESTTKKTSDSDRLERLTPTQGFANLGNTCYANSAMKLLLCSIEPSTLHTHLKTLLNDQILSKSDREAIEAFLPIIENSCLGKDTLRTELISFFKKLQQTKDFKNFLIVGKQHDANEFLVKLATLFKLEQITNKIGRGTTITDPHNSDHKVTRPPQNSRWILESTVSSPSTTPQQMWNELSAPETIEYKWGEETIMTPATKAFFYEMDTTLGNTLLHHLTNTQFNPYGKDESASRKIILTNPKFDSIIKFNCIDTNDHQPYQIELKPKHLIIHQGSSATSGHYTFYSERNDGRWDVHNDSQVSICDKLNANEQAKVIGYEIISRTQKLS